MAKALNNDKIKEIIDTYETGLYNIKETAKIVGLTESTVTKYLKLNNIEYNMYGLSNFQISETIRLYQDEKLSEENVGKEVGLCRTTVRKILKSNNVQIREQKDWLTKYPLNENYFEEIDTPNKAYILGFFYADGNVSGKNNTVQIGLQSRDGYILERMLEEFGCPEHPLYLNEKSKKRPKLSRYNIALSQEPKTT